MTNITMTATSSMTIPPTTLKTTARTVVWDKAVGLGEDGVTAVELSVVELSVAVGVESVAVARYKQMQSVYAIVQDDNFIAI